MVHWCDVTCTPQTFSLNILSVTPTLWNTRRVHAVASLSIKRFGKTSLSLRERERQIYAVLHHRSAAASSLSVPAASCTSVLKV